MTSADQQLVPPAIAVNTSSSYRYPGISQAVRVGQFVFVGGVVSIDPASGQKVLGGVEHEAEQMFANLENVLGATGAILADVVKITMYVRDWADFSAIDAVYQSRFANVPVPPARATIAVSGIGSGCLCELEAIAVARS